jgi:hypothetical protein
MDFPSGLSCGASRRAVSHEGRLRQETAHWAGHKGKALAFTPRFPGNHAFFSMATTESLSEFKVVKAKTSCNRELGAPVQVHPQGGEAQQTCLTACREMVCRASHMRTGSSGPSEANGTNKIGQSSSLSSIVSRFCIANLALFFLQKSVVSDSSQRAVLRLFEMYLQFRRRNHLC